MPYYDVTNLLFIGTQTSKYLQLENNVQLISFYVNVCPLSSYFFRINS